MIWSVAIPGDPPSLNATYRVVHHPPFCPTCRRGTPRLGKAPTVETWQTEVAWLTKGACPSGWVPGRRTVIEIEFYVSREGRDADGPIKALLDGIKVGLGCDDRGFLPRVTSIEKDKALPRTMVRIWNVE